jgi:signal peptidase
MDATRSFTHQPSVRRAGRVRRAAVAVAGATCGLLLATALVLAAAMQLFGYRVTQASSGSMEPFLEPGDVFVTRPIDIADVEKGDVVLFDQGRDTLIPVAHRVVGIVQLKMNITDSGTGEVTTEITQVLRTQGDANPEPDSQLVDVSRLRGVVWFRVPGAGRLFGSLGLQGGLLLVAVAIGIVWGLFELVRLLKRHSSPSGVGR